MTAAFRLSPRQQAAAALAAALTSACVLSTVVLVFDAANPVPEVPALAAWRGERVTGPAPARALAEPDCVMDKSRPARGRRCADVAGPDGGSVPRGREPEAALPGSRIATLQAGARPLPHADLTPTALHP